VKGLKVCTFFGHRSVMHAIEEELCEQIRRAIEQDGVREFWCGGMGAFDLRCAQIVRKLKKDFPDIRLALVLPSARNAASAGALVPSAYDEFFVCDASDGAYPKQAITLRNRWIAENADLLIAYVQKDFGGAYTAVRQALKKKKPVRFIRENPDITQRLEMKL